MEKVSLLKVESYDNKLKKNINKLVDLIGGFNSFVRPGDKVLIKPTLQD